MNTASATSPTTSSSPHAHALGRARNSSFAALGTEEEILAEVAASKAAGAPDEQAVREAAARWHVRFLQEVPNVDLRESQAVLGLLAAIPVNRLAAAALAELLSSRRSCKRIAETLVRWAVKA